MAIVRAWLCLAPEHEGRCTAEKPGHLQPPTSRHRTSMYFCGEVDIAIRCDGDGCTREVPIEHGSRSKWDMIKLSSRDGWFFRRDETLAYCLEHLPAGIIAWRDWENPGWRGRLAKGLADRLPSVESARELARGHQRKV